jgi:hypothetical protein
MSLGFPDAPNVNDEHTVNGTTYFWTGTKWKRKAIIVTPTSSQTLVNKTVENITLDAGYSEEVYTLSGSANVILDPSNGSIQVHTLTANTSYVDSLVSSESLLLNVDANVYTVTWPSVTWFGNTAPTFENGTTTTVQFLKKGNTLYGLDLGNFGTVFIPDGITGGIDTFAEGAYGTGGSVNTSTINIGDIPSASQKRYVFIAVGTASETPSDSVLPTTATSSSSGSLTSAGALGVASPLPRSAGVRIFYYENNTDTSDSFTINHINSAAVSVHVYAIYAPSTANISTTSYTAQTGSSTTISTSGIAASNVLIAVASCTEGTADPDSTTFTGPGSFVKTFATDSVSDNNVISGIGIDTPGSGTVTVTDSDSNAKALVSVGINFT